MIRSIDIGLLLDAFDAGKQVQPYGLAASTIKHGDQDLVVALIHPKLWRRINQLLDKHVGMSDDPRSGWDGKL